MSALTRDEILSKRTPVLERVSVPEWELNGTTEVCVRRFSARSKLFLSECVDRAKEQGHRLPLNWWGLVCALSICDEDGNRLFTDPKDPDVIADMDSEVVDRVYQVAARLNGLSAPSVEAITKNSEPSQSDASSSL